MFGNVHVTFGQVLENLQKSLENRSEQSHRYANITKRTLQVSAANE